MNLAIRKSLQEANPGLVPNFKAQAFPTYMLPKSRVVSQPLATQPRLVTQTTPESWIGVHMSLHLFFRSFRRMFKWSIPLKSWWKWIKAWRFGLSLAPSVTQSHEDNYRIRCWGGFVMQVPMLSFERPTKGWSRAKIGSLQDAMKMFLTREV